LTKLTEINGKRHTAKGLSLFGFHKEITFLSSPLAINPSCFVPNLAHVAFALLGRKNSSKKNQI